MRYSRPGIAGASQRASRLSECGGIIPPPRASAPRESDLPTPCGGMFFPGKVGYLQRAGFRKRRPFPPARPASFGERAMSTRPAPTLHDPALCRALTRRLEDLLQRMATPRLRFMEVCGTHTVAIFRGGLRALLPEGVTHLTGPGCPVCVTDDSEVAAFLKLAEQPGVILATFGDLMRVPGPDGLSLKHAQAAGARISVIYSPLDALSLAAAHPQDLVIFLGVGFETTAPATAATILTAEQRGIDNFAVCTRRSSDLPFSSPAMSPPCSAPLLTSSSRATGAAPRSSRALNRPISWTGFAVWPPNMWMETFGWKTPTPAPLAKTATPGRDPSWIRFFRCATLRGAALAALRTAALPCALPIPALTRWIGSASALRRSGPSPVAAAAMCSAAGSRRMPARFSARRARHPRP